MPDFKNLILVGRLRAIILITALTAFTSTFAADSYTAHYINMQRGLPHNFVDDIYRDSKGFMWISLGGGGLVRYDGYGFVRFSTASPIYRIPGEFVHSVTEDRFSRLWVATDNGLAIIDMSTLLPAALDDPDGILTPYLTANIYSTHLDAKGRVWLRTPDGIACIETDSDGKILHHSSMKYGTQARFNGTIVRDIDGDGSVWTSIDGNICKLTPDGTGIKVKNYNIALPDEAIVSDILLHDRYVWIATDKGLLRHSISHRDTKTYRHNPSDPASLAQDMVTDIEVVPPGTAAIPTATEGILAVSTLNGISYYDRATDTFVNERAGSGRLNSNFINCIVAVGDQIWVGTESGGVNLWVPKRFPSSFYAHTAVSESISPNPVNSVYEDSRGTLWVGTVEGGLNRREAGRSGFDHFTTANSLNHNTVSAITADPHGNLWIGTWGGGIDILDHDNPANRTKHISTFDTYGERVYIGALIYDDINDGVWIGTSQGLFFYDCASEKIVEPYAGAATAANGCIGAAIDRDSHLWVGTMDGVVDIDLKSRDGNRWRHRSITEKLDAPGRGIREKLSSVYVGADGTLWLGSDIHGLYRRKVDERGQETFVNLTTENGLIKNTVLGIADDNSGRLWIATNSGLSCYYPAADRFVNYFQAQGLQSDQFYWNATTRTSDGLILMGTTDGLVQFDPSLVTEDHASHKVVFTHLQVDNQPVDFDPEISPMHISMAEGIRLHERNRSFSVEFSALDYEHNPEYHYYYKLEGFDKEWIRLPEDRNFVTYTNLSPGSYRLLVSYHPEGAEDYEVSELRVDIDRYFYHTLWFYLIILAAIVIGILAFYRWRLRRVNRQKQELEKAVEERTSEINEQKKMLEERTMRIQELTVERLSFFTNLTHEFRTPITLIMGPVRRALQLCNEKPVSDQLKYVERNAGYLLNLVNQLMDFRKMESGKIEIVRKRSDFAAFIDEVLGTFSQLADDRHISLTSHLHMYTTEICYDKEAMRKLLSNFLSNAVKYTPDGGSIHVAAALLPRQCGDTDTERLYLTVSDTGDGIAPADIEKVFDRFYQGTTAMKYPNMQASSGIGLHLCKMIVEAYGGSVSVHNNPVKGCTFRILLPVPDSDESGETTAMALQPAAQPQAAAEQEHGRKPVILVVEDNTDMRGYIRSILDDTYTVVEAANGREALDRLAETDIDFIISDLMMPVIDGIELARKVKENFATSHIPILMLTAKGSDETRLESYRTGVDDFIQKPFSEEMLLVRVRNILDNKRRMQQRFALDYNTDNLEVEESRDKKFVNQVMEVLNQNYKNSYFDVGDFAEALGVSRSFLNKKLQSLVGQSAGEMIRNYRLTLAHKLIVANRTTRDRTISEIAYDVGFNDSKYFTRCFSKHFGLTPSALMTSDN